ncbi:site-specific integrase [Nocardioides sp. NPDC092400]|uniref:tyrosine-type recombinase/integrase n=1 Tax=Nocardioides sp. NPDC092400 TaxID=3155196 RepID=UPI0034168AD9
MATPDIAPTSPTSPTSAAGLSSTAGPTGTGGQERGSPAQDACARPDQDLWAQVVDQWRASGDITEQTAQRAGETLQRFLRRQAALGATRPETFTAEQCADFVHARGLNGRAPEVTTMHARRTALRMAFRTLRELGYEVGDPTVDLVLPPRTSTAARPLTDDEVVLCRTSARLGEAGSASLQRAVIWALGESTAISSEISAIRIRDVDDPEAPRWVRLPGTRRCDPRLGELSEWGTVIVARQIGRLREQRATPTTLLTYKGAGTPGEATAQASVANAIGAVLRYAGLAAEPDVRPASLRNWAGRRLFDAGLPIDQVARRMGCRSLDAAAEDIGLTWRTR